MEAHEEYIGDYNKDDLDLIKCDMKETLDACEFEFQIITGNNDDVICSERKLLHSYYDIIRGNLTVESNKKDH